MNINFFMQVAIQEANIALKNNEVPVGGVLVDNETNKIITKTHNKINDGNNAILHCELILINNACEKLKSKYLNETTLFITLEPCVMCAAAISEAHISAIYFGAFDEKKGGIEKLRIAYKRNNIYLPQIYGGILEEESANLLKNFFRNKRNES